MFSQHAGRAWLLISIQALMSGCYYYYYLFVTLWLRLFSHFNADTKVIDFVGTLFEEYTHAFLRKSHVVKENFAQIKYIPHLSKIGVKANCFSFHNVDMW